MLADPLPATVVMVTLAAVTTVLYPPLGILALAMFAVIAVLPQNRAVPRRAGARSRRVGPWSRRAATRTRWRCTWVWTAPSAATWSA